MGNYTINGVKNCSRTKGSLRLLLFLIADAIPDNTGYYTLTTEALATYCNYEERFTRRLLNRLVPTGELIKVTRPGKKVVYMIPILEGEPGYDPQPCDGTSHECTGYHTPLDRTRDELYRAFYAAKKTLDKARYDHTAVTQKDPGTMIPGSPVRSYPPPRYDDTGDPGTIDPPYPISTQSDKPKDKPKGAKTSFQSRKEKPESRAESARHSEPSTEPAHIIEMGVRTPEPPPVAPAPPAPSIHDFYDWLKAAGYKKVPGQGLKPIEKLIWEDARYNRVDFSEVCAAYEAATHQGVAL